MFAPTLRGGAAAAFACLLTALPASAQDAAIYSDMDRVHPVWARSGMVASQEAVATGIGVDILRRGGNAVDAAVAVGFALAVTLPQAGNLGGGGFMLIHDAESGESIAIDYREKAPGGSTRDMFLDATGAADSTKSQKSALAVGVPGTVAGLALALERYGTMSLPDVLQSAIRLAEEGIVVTPDLSDSLKASEELLKAWPSSAAIFFKEGETPYEPGETLRQPDLAKSLRQIAEGGPEAFYKGETARLIAEQMKREGGLITLEDMAGYAAVIREPVRGSYRGYDVVSMPPPSSGGVHIIQLLNILEGFPIGYLGHNSAETIHLMAEAMKLAYADRSEYLGDSDFVEVPVKGLSSKAYADLLRKKINPNRPVSSATIKRGDPAPFESDQITTVLQVIMNTIDHGMNIAEATEAVRVHHQWLPDEVRIEEGLGTDTIRLLEAAGHNVRVQPVMGSTHSIARREDGSLFGASDPRRPSALTAGY